MKNSFKGVHVHVKGHIADFSEIEYFSKKANAVKSFDKNFHSIRMFGLTAQTDADIDVDADVSDDVGVVVFENDNYAGMSVSLLGPDADELEDDNGGEASVQQIDTLKTLGSMLIPKGYQVTVFASRGGVQSHMPEMVLDSDSVGLNEALSELGFDTKKHHLRVEHTCDECDHGICSGPNQCTCQKGWVGEACDVQLPDATSAVVCESSFAFVGVGVQCKVLPRIKGK